ncbi:MAG TPA: hypothetical protein VK661_05440 [Planctomycetota bacterium]|nr:hypothetical protein [Planctomycetota bacterium]
MHMRIHRAILAIGLAIPLAGCWTGDGALPGAQIVFPGLPPLAVNSPNTFTMVPMGPILNGTYAYTWSCGVGQANLTIAGITGGSIRIEIEDGAGAIVHDNRYDGGLMGAISAMTSPDGASGDWRLRFTFENVASVGAIAIDADLYDDPDDITIAGAYALESTYFYEAGWPAGPAQVTLASAISLGTVRIRMWDGNGALVMDRTNFAIFIGAFNGDSDSGAAGTWRIRIDVDAVATAGAITITHP